MFPHAIPIIILQAREPETLGTQIERLKLETL